MLIMPAKPSGEIKTLIVRSKQKNGDTYLLDQNFPKMVPKYAIKQF